MSNQIKHETMDSKEAACLHTQTGYLTPTAPFDFTRSLEVFKTFSPFQEECHVGDQALTMAINACDQIIVFRLISQGTTDTPELAYTLYSAQPIASDVIASALNRISFLLSLDDDLTPMYTIARNDAHFAPIMHELYGYHQVKFATPFQSACWAALAQRNLRNTTLRMKHALLETYGKTLQVDGITYRAFPDTSQLEDITESELLLVLKNARKAEYIHGVVQAFNQFDEQHARTADYEEIADWLHNIHGFGAWSVSFIMLRGLGRYEEIPFSEKATMEAASRLYGNGIDLTRREVAHLGAPYGSLQGYWAHYLRVGA
jgi:DNA-3-methyladenine glycosylase II